MADIGMINQLGITRDDFRWERSWNEFLHITPYVMSDLMYIEEPLIEANILTHIAKSIQAGEEQFKKKFGGFRPQSSEFGINTLRPNQVNYTRAGTNEWIWTSGAVASLLGAFENWIGPFNLPIDRLVLVYGYFNVDAVPNTMQLQALMGDKTLPVQDIQHIEFKDEQYFLLPTIGIVIPFSTLNITVSAKQLNWAEKMGLIGYCFGNNSEIIATV